MADLVPVAANVIADATGTQTSTGTCGSAALSQMQAAYLDANNLWQLMGAGGTGAVSGVGAQMIGLVLDAASPGQPVTVLTGGGLNPGCTVVVGTRYDVSHNLGHVAPEGDLVTNDWITELAFADANNHLVMTPKVWNKQKP